MHILLTNDDGFEAPGLAALAAALRPIHQVSIVAPAREQSSTGHSATLRGAVRVRHIQHPTLGGLFAVDGTPVDCVRLAVAELLDKPLDAVVSGINLGANASVVDVNCSGTVAAAREGAFCGLRAAAISQMFDKNTPVQWDAATRIVERLLPNLLGRGLPPRIVWNVNIPILAKHERPVGVSVVPLAPEHIPLEFSAADEATDERSYTYDGYYLGRIRSPGNDVDALFSKHVSITPLCVDQTDHKNLSLLAGLTL